MTGLARADGGCGKRSDSDEKLVGVSIINKLYTQ